MSICFTGMIGVAQTALQPGDPLPKTVIRDVWNYKTREIRLSDFKGKMIILDFWSTGCISCLESFPHVDSVQKKFADKIQIILVARESSQTIAAFFKKKVKLHKPDVPMICSDRLLNQLLPHQGVPFNAWINSDGTLLYTGESRYLSIANLQKVIKGEEADIKAPQRKDYKYSMLDDDMVSLAGSYSCISKGKRGLQIDGGERKGFKVITTVPLEAADLYRYAWDGLTGFQYNFRKRPGVSIFEESADSKKLIVDRKSTEWKENNLYCYQMWVPSISRKNEWEIMKEDLDRYFGFESRVEKRSITSLVLVRKNNEDLLSTRGGTIVDTWDRAGLRSEKTDSFTILRNLPFSLLSKRLKAYIEYFFKLPFEDQSGYEGNIDMQFRDTALQNLQELKKVLQQYGLNLEERRVEQDVLVISEKK